jgi:hypothetical protein
MVMHNDTPLGITMHLRDLDRRASPQLDRSPAARDAPPATDARAVMFSLLRRLGVIAIPGGVASQG